MSDHLKLATAAVWGRTILLGIGVLLLAGGTLLLVAMLAFSPGWTRLAALPFVPIYGGLLWLCRDILRTERDLRRTPGPVGHP